MTDGFNDGVNALTCILRERKSDNASEKRQLIF